MFKRHDRDLIEQELKNLIYVLSQTLQPGVDPVIPDHRDRVLVVSGYTLHEVGIS